MKTFYRLLGVALIAITTNNFVWFALTFWAYLTTKSVISTSIIAGIWIVAAALSANWFGTIVDHSRKKYAMLGSSIATAVLFSAGFLLFRFSREGAFATVESVQFWLFALCLLSGAVAGSMYNIALPTLVAFLVPEDRRARANGLLGSVMGVSFAVTSVASGLALAFGGMSFVLATAIVLTLAAAGLLYLIPIPEEAVRHASEQKPKTMDVKGTVRAVRAIPGLFPLIFFTTFNNFLGGVYMSLGDAYGLSLMTVQYWGLLNGLLSIGFIIGGLIIAKKGLGTNPVRNLFRINIVLWNVCVFFTIQPSILLLAAGGLVYMTLVPFIEATEQTIFQKVVPKERLGRVFGFAHSVEQAASPFTAFMIGPIAQLVFVPFMTTGRGVDLIGGWFGTGAGRGLALVFILAGLVGLAVTLSVMRSRPYKMLAARYLESAGVKDVSPEGNTAG